MPAILIVALVVLIILAVAFWKQNSKLKTELNEFKQAEKESEGVIVDENISASEELELLQKQLNQLKELQKRFD